MGNEYVKQYRIDYRLESYQPFFDHEWANEMYEIVNEKNKLGELVFDLGVSFKGISRMSSIPSLSVEVAQSYSEGHNLEALSNSLTVKLVNHIAARIDQKIVLNSDQTRGVKAAMLDIAEEVNRSVEGKSEEFPRQGLWDDFVKVEEGEEIDHPKNEFRLALWSCQRICYSSLFFAYEDFLVRCLSIESGSNVRVDSDFNRVCRNILGDELAEQCWIDQKIYFAKQIRHALVHSGGRETRQLIDQNHGIQVVGGVLQIMPCDVTSLFNLLKTRAMKLVEWATHLPAFQ